MTEMQTEAEMMQSIVPELEAEGYDVFLTPSRPIVPAFLEGFQPDIIAHRGNQKLVVEIKRRSKSAEDEVQRLSKLLSKQQGWSLRLVWIEPASDSKALPIQSRDTVEGRISEVNKLVAGQHMSAALLLAWATFEAAARALSNSAFTRPQTPGRLIEVLASDGTIRPSEADLLRRLAQQRNKLIHGELTVMPTQDEMKQFALILVELSQTIANV
jgi:Holliday junction resolvase